MQSELSRLEEQLRRALEGEAWHGPFICSKPLKALDSEHQPPRSRGLQSNEHDHKPAK